MQPGFAKKLGFCIHKTNDSTQKIDTSRFQTFGIVIALLEVDNKEEKSCFFTKTFLLADMSMDVAFAMSFFTLSNVEIKFNNRELG